MTANISNTSVGESDTTAFALTPAPVPANWSQRTRLAS
jgi:hypothetical protein